MNISKQSVLVLVAFSILVLISISVLDIPIAVWVSENGRTISWVFQILTRTGDSTYYIIPTLILILISWYGWARTKQPELRRIWSWTGKCSCFVFLAVILSGLVVNIIKIFVGRARPSQYFEFGYYGFNPPGFDYAFKSFPSGHACTIMAIALCICFFTKRYQTLVLLLGSFLALSRVMLNAHFLSDVIAGGIVAVVTCFLLREHLAKRQFVFEHAHSENGTTQIVPCSEVQELRQMIVSMIKYVKKQ